MKRPFVSRVQLLLVLIAAVLPIPVRAQTHVYARVAQPVAPSAPLGTYRVVAVNRSTGPLRDTVYVYDARNGGQIRLFRPQSSTQYADTGWRVIPASPPDPLSPIAVKVLPDNSIWLFDGYGRTIASAPHPSAQTPVTTATVRVKLDNVLPGPRGFAITGDYYQAKVYVYDAAAVRPVQRYDIYGTGLATICVWTSSPLNVAIHDAVGDPSGNVYLATEDPNGLVVRFTATDPSGSSPLPIVLRPAWMPAPVEPGLDFVPDGAMPGGGYLLYGIRFGFFTPYHLAVYRFAGNGSYLDGFGPDQPGAPGWSVVDIQHPGPSTLGADGEGNVFVGSASGDMMSIVKVAAGSLSPSPAPKPGDVVINQVYGGGAAGASVFSGFVELYNRSATKVNVTGWTLQFAASASAFPAVLSDTNTAVLAGSIAPHAYYHVRLAAGPNTVALCNAPDAVCSTSVDSRAFKVVLVSNSQPLGAVACPSGGSIIDLVGVGAGTNCFEGTGPAPSMSPSIAVMRNCSGTDTNNNALDFVGYEPTARNSLTTGGLPPSITGPTSQTLCPGMSGTLVISVSGTAPLQIQWYAGVPGAGTPIPGATATSYTTGQTGSYYATVQNGCGERTSAVATLTASAPPTITSEPSDVVVSPGTTGTLSVIAAGMGSLSYQWYRGVPPSGTILAGASASQLTIGQAGSYYVTVTNYCGTVSSRAARVRVRPSVQAVTFTSASVYPSQSSLMAATVDPGSETVTSVVADVSALSKVGSVTLSWNAQSGRYEATVTTDSGLAAGDKVVAVTATSAPDLSGTGTGRLAILAARLAFAVQPGGVPALNPLDPQPVIAVQDGNGQPLSTYSGPVTLSLVLGTGASGAALRGTTTVSARNGLAAFNGLSVDRTGTGYVLLARSGDLPAAQSLPFTIGAAAAGPWGDVDGDGFVTVADSDLVSAYLAGAPMSAAQKDRIRRYGDVAGVANSTLVGNDVVDAEDARRALLLASGLIDTGTVGVDTTAYGDVNHDGRCDIADAVCIYRAAKGIPQGQDIDRAIHTHGVGDISPTAGYIAFGDGAITAEDALLIRQRALGTEANPPAYVDYWPLRAPSTSLPGMKQDAYTFTDQTGLSGDMLHQIAFEAQAPRERRGYTVIEMLGTDGSVAGLYKGRDGSIFALYLRYPYAFGDRLLEFTTPIKLLDMGAVTGAKASWTGATTTNTADLGVRPVVYTGKLLGVGDVYTSAAGSFTQPSDTPPSSWSQAVRIRLDVAVLAGPTSQWEMQQAFFFTFMPHIGPVARGQAPIRGTAAPTKDRPLLSADEVVVRGIPYNLSTP